MIDWFDGRCLALASFHTSLYADIKRKDEELQQKSKTSWLRTNLLESDVVAPEGGGSATAWAAYYYNRAAFVANER